MDNEPDEKLEQLVRELMTHVARISGVDESGRPYLILKFQGNYKFSFTERVYLDDLKNEPKTFGVAFGQLITHIERKDVARIVKRQKGASIGDQIG
jgi:hypothetical protein